MQVQTREGLWSCTPAKGHLSMSLGAISVWIKLGRPYTIPHERELYLCRGNLPLVTPQGFWMDFSSNLLLPTSSPQWCAYQDPKANHQQHFPCPSSRILHIPPGGLRLGCPYPASCSPSSTAPLHKFSPHSADTDTPWSPEDQRTVRHTPVSKQPQKS